MTGAYAPTAANTVKRTKLGPTAQEDQYLFAMEVLKSIYGLKQSGRIWYKRFKAEMLSLDFINDDIAPCLFIKSVEDEFIIIAIYVDDINIFGTPSIIAETIQTLKSVFEMKDIGKPAYCLGIQFDYLPDGILIHQST